MTVEEQIRRANESSVRLEHLLFEKPYTIKTNRDGLCLRYWSLVFEIHQGILLLLLTKHYAPAFALMRPIAEPFFRLHVAIHGTEAQLASLKNGTYNTEFEKVGEQIDQTYGLEPLFGPWFNKNRTSILHGFTHGGLEQLMRRSSGTEIIPNYSEEEVRDVVLFTTLFAFLTALAITDFLGFKAEFETASQMFSEYLHPTSGQILHQPCTKSATDPTNSQQLTTSREKSNR